MIDSVFPLNEKEKSRHMDYFGTYFVRMRTKFTLVISIGDPPTMPPFENNNTITMHP